MNRMLRSISKRLRLPHVCEAHTVAAPRQKSLLVDGNNLLYFYYGRQRRGTVPHAPVAQLNAFLHRMSKRHQLAHICVFFDSKSKNTARRSIPSSYKHSYAPTPTDLRPQLSSAPSILRSGGVNCFRLSGYEADDLLASYADALQKHGHDILIASNDNDFLQLVCDATREDATSETSVEVYQPNKNRYMREKSVRGRYGVPPALVPAFQALCGTPNTKIQGIQDVPSKVAVELLLKYKSLPALLRALDDVDDEHVRRSLKEGISQVETSLRLSTLMKEVPLPLDVMELASPELSSLKIE